MTLYKGNKVIAGSRSYIGNIGDIKYTTRVDLPFGGSWCDGSIKLKAQFPTVYQMLIDGKLQALDIATYESALNLNGSCGFFGLDTATESFRVPSLNDVYIKSGQVADEFGAESLPNITGKVNAAAGDYTGDLTKASGAFKNTEDRQAIWWYNNNNFGIRTVDFDASRSSSAYQDGAKVNPDHVKYRAYVVLYTGADTNIDITKEIQLNNPFFFGMSQWLESDPKNASWLLSDGAFHSGAIYESFYNWLLSILNGEAVEGVSVKSSTDTYGDYDYVVNTAEGTFRLPIYDGSESLPSDRYDNLTLGASTSTYTAPANGDYVFSVLLPASAYFAIFNGNTNSVASLLDNPISAIEQNYVAKVSVKKGQVIRIQYTSVKNTNSVRFYYATGNGSLYFYVGETVQDANLINASKVLDLLAKLESYDYVVEYKAPTAEDPSWYRIYKSGWIEQGGKIPHQTSSKDVNVVLHKKMLDTSYNFSGCVVYSSNAQTDHREATNELASKTTTGFTKYIWTTWKDFYWQVSGQGV